MFRLHTLGTLSLESDSGPLTGGAAQPKRLKLLALLDRAGPQGVNREQLVEHFWADGDSERGRGSLNTAISALRQHLGADALLTTAEQVRLDAAHVVSDAREFEAALDAGRLEHAVALYKGPFLDGNDRRESQRFEEWVRVERERLDARYRRALDALAADAARRGDRLGAVAWWDRLLAVDPLDSRVAAALVHALVAADDRARALRVASIHDALLREHEVEPPPAWTDVAARLRDGRLVATPQAPSVAIPVAPPVPVDAGETRAPTEPAASRRRPLRWAVVAAVVAAALLVTVRRGLRGFDPSPAALDPRRVAMLYLADGSEGARLGGLAAQLTEGVIDDLQRVPVLQVIAPDGVRPYRGQAVPPDSIARRLRVGTIVSGTVDSAGGALRVTLRLLDGESADLLASDTLTRPLARDGFAAAGRALAADVTSALRRRLGEQITLREQELAASSDDARALVVRVRRMERDELSPDYALDPGDLAMAYARADSLLAQAERLDPRWIVPPIRRARLAEERALRAWLAGGTWPPPNVQLHGAAGAHRSAVEWRRVGLAHAERALRLGPNDANALETRGRLRYGLWQWSTGVAPDSLLDGAIADLQAAVDARPDLASARTALSLAHQKAGNFGLARLAAERALDTYLGPDAGAVTSDLVFIALHEERYDDARRLCADGRRRFPDVPDLWGCEVVVLGWTGTRPADAARAWRVVDSLEASEPAEFTKVAWAQRRMFVAAILARAGLADSAEALLRVARSADPNATQPWLDADEAYVRVRLGQPDSALALLRRYVARNPAERRSVAATPWFRALRSVPAFDRLTRPDG